MNRSIPKIREQLTQIENQTAILGHHFAATYDQYAQRLGQILRQQGVYAVYQICTQIYPDTFLQLDYNPRHKFQSQLRTAIAKFYDQLLANLEKEGIFLDSSRQGQIVPEPEGNTEDAEELILLGNNGDNPEEEKSEDGNVPDLQEIKDFLSQALQKEGLSLEMLLPQGMEVAEAKVPTVIKTPEDLQKWHLQVEKVLHRSVVALSMNINRLLTASKIIPPNLPLHILEMALQSEDDRLAPNREKMPHVVNLLIEKAQKPESDHVSQQSTDQGEEDGENDDDEDLSPEALEELIHRSKRGQISRLTALNLRLKDLEFSDVNLGLIRKQIHTYLKDLNKLEKQYRQLERQQVTAKAELAWRSTWQNQDNGGA
ncbi:hypothetical protein IQE94_07705 [Synechocystis sp. PCC 7339]|uniref:hypothetical protein n=1 Tax=unclassified Synechocystis TaxID=2640012 RepID=UPI001BAF4388|nr:MULTISPECIES: hypothetical protein [unclassified Synechocystis]QUS61929.1 hypothetical protein HTZ78_15495 [Synechocystis sp. PCC 7338]UAJ74123.1 hypothetical protein IQE94_07705 [Synechocystis sp. PCC 7339]